MLIHRPTFQSQVVVSYPLTPPYPSLPSPPFLLQVRDSYSTLHRRPRPNILLPRGCQAVGPGWGTTCLLVDQLEVRAEVGETSIVATFSPMPQPPSRPASATWVREAAVSQVASGVVLGVPEDIQVPLPHQVTSPRVYLGPRSRREARVLQADPVVPLVPVVPGAPVAPEEPEASEDSAELEEAPQGADLQASRPTVEGPRPPVRRAGLPVRREGPLVLVGGAIQDFRVIRRPGTQAQASEIHLVMDQGTERI